MSSCRFTVVRMSAVLVTMVLTGCGVPFPVPVPVSQPAPVSIDLAGIDPCSALDARDQQDLFIGDGEERDEGARRTCEFAHLRIDIDVLLTFIVGTSLAELRQLASADDQNETVLWEVSVSGVPALRVESRDPDNGHTGCIVVAELSDRQVASVWDSDLQGGDASMSDMCSHATTVAERLFDRLGVI